MKIRLVTTIEKPLAIVHKNFNESLFKFLLPPFNLAGIERYEGQNPGDIIEIRFNLPFIPNWKVIIKESWLHNKEYGFIDRGLKVPFGITFWKHIHRVVAKGEKSSFIIDDIEYESNSNWLNYILFLFLLLMFYPRKFLYKKYYKELIE